MQFRPKIEHTLRNFTHETLEWQLADQQLRRFLITTDFTKSHRSRPEPVRLLYTSRHRRRLPRLLRRQLFTRRFTTTLRVRNEHQPIENAYPVDLRAVCLVRAIVSFACLREFGGRSLCAFLYDQTRAFKYLDRRATSHSAPKLYFPHVTPKSVLAIHL